MQQNTEIKLFEEQKIRIIRSIPSPKVEPFKQWLAKVGYERIKEIIDPAQGIDRARENWLKLGRSEKWKIGCYRRKLFTACKIKKQIKLNIPDYTSPSLRLSSLRGAERRSNPVFLYVSGLLHFVRNDGNLCNEGTTFCQY